MSCAVEVKLPLCPVMVGLPTLAEVAGPLALMLATALLEEDQVAELDRFCVEPSEKVPVSVYCRVEPFGSDPLAGVTAPT